MKRVYPKTAAVAKPSSEDFLTTLEVLCREKIGQVLQAVLEAEVDEFLGRIRGARGGLRAGYRDGHEDPRTITYGSHPICVRRPRVRQSDERFISQVLPPYRRRFEDVDKTLHELWIQGLSTRDFEPSLRALLGEETPLSPSTISRVNKHSTTNTRPGAGARSQTSTCTRGQTGFIWVPARPTNVAPCSW